MMDQLLLMLAVSLLVGMSSAALVWFGTDLLSKVRIVLGHWLAVRKAKAEAAKAAKAAAADEDER